MEISRKGIELIKKFEGCRLKAYKCSAGVPTIGYGNTYYENGDKVKIGDTITLERAEQLLKELVKKYYHQHENITQNQFNAITSFCYNVGNANYNKSTLKKKLLKNPNDPTIRDEFMKWNKGGGKELLGLTRRRKAEADLYFSK
jgi:lysozyme